jgi:hypothetical protein
MLLGVLGTVILGCGGLAVATGSPPTRQSAASSTTIPIPLPPGGTLPPGVSVPTQTTLPAPGALSGTIGQLVEQFVSRGKLPANLSASQLGALFEAPTALLPAELQTLVGALRQLGSQGLDEPLAAEVACLLGSSSTLSSFGGLQSVSWATPAVDALAGAGVLSGILQASATGAFAPDQAVSQWQWLAVLLRLLGALPIGIAPGTHLTPSAIMRLAKAKGLLAADESVTAAVASHLDLAQALTFALRALGIDEAASQLALQVQGAGTSTLGPPSPAGAMALFDRLGLLDDIGSSPLKPFTRADAAALVARVLSLFDATLQALGKPALSSVSPSLLEAGTTATITGNDLGQAPGTLTWEPTTGRFAHLAVSSWSATKVSARLPSSAAPGAGRLVLETSGGATASAPAEVVALKLRILRHLPGGDVELLVDGRTFYLSSAAAAALEHMPVSSQVAWSSQASAELAGTRRADTSNDVPQDPPLQVRSLPAPRVSDTQRLARSADTSDPCAQGCETTYGPDATPYSSVLSSAQVNYEVPCVTVLGYKVCSGWADAGTELAGTINGVGSPTGYFTEVGSALSGASLITAASMDATVGLTYTPKRAGDLVVVEAKVITDQVDGGVGVAGAGTAPAYAYGAATGYGSQEQTIASRFDTISASVATWPDLSAVDLADQALTKLDAISDTAQALWQLEGLPGEVGTSHVATFTWAKTAAAGEALHVSVDTQALVASNGLSQTEVNALSGVVLVKILERSPVSQPIGSSGICTNPTGVSGTLAISSVTPPSAHVGATITVAGSGFGDSGQLAFYNPVLGTVVDAPIETWGPTRVQAQVPYTLWGTEKLFVLPSPYSCSPETPVSFTIGPPALSAMTLSTSWQGPSLTVSGDGFGPAPCPLAGVVRLECEPGATGSIEGPGTVSLELVRGPGGHLPPAPVSVNVTPEVTSWTGSGFSLSLGPLLGEAESPLAHLAPGTYEVRLTRSFSNGGFALAEAHSPYTSGSLDFVVADHWPIEQVSVVRDLGEVTIPATTLRSVVVAETSSSHRAVGPGTVLVVEGDGFGALAGSVVLVGPYHAVSVPYGSGWPGDAGTVVVPSYDIDAWSAHRVVFSVPQGLSSGTFVLWVLHAGWGPWSEAGSARSLTIAQPACPCLAGGPACGLSSAP